MIGGVNAKAMIDTGCRRNLIDEKSWTLLKSNGVIVFNKSKSSDRAFNAYDKHVLPVLGTFDSDLIINNFQSHRAKFYVMKGAGEFLIGRDTVKAMGLVKYNTVRNVNKDIPMLLKIKGITVDIPLKVDVKPVVQPYRRIPVPLEKTVDERVDTMLKQGMIEKVNGPSRWISPLVIVPRKNSDEIRICVDMQPSITNFRRVLAALGQSQGIQSIDRFLHS